MEVASDSKAAATRGLVRGPSKWLVSCGENVSKDPSYWPGMRTQSGTVLVVSPTERAELPDGQVGELWISGKCVTAGYWNNAPATAAAYSARISSACSTLGQQHLKSSFYRTGDLGVKHKGELYITGRQSHKQGSSSSKRAVG